MNAPFPFLDAIVIGAGHAGLSMSRCLQREGLAHIVLERERVGASWRTRWDSFYLNTPNEITVLPDGEAPGSPEGFASRDTWVRSLESYAREHELPIREGVEVRSVTPIEGGYEVQTSHESLRAKNVILCTGDQNVPKIPAVAEQLPSDIDQRHCRDYRSAASLPPGGVLVVGSGQSGGQIVEDLLDAGRDVWLCTSRVGRAPRRYRGRDVTAWMGKIGMFDQKPGDVEPAERQAAQPLISGTEGGHSLSLPWLGRRGAKLLGRLSGVEGRTLRIEGDLLENVAFGDAFAAKICGGLDTFFEKAGVAAPKAESDPADEPFEGLDEAASIRELDLDAAGIRSVIWATGFGGDFSYLPPAFLNDSGRLRHTDGVCAPGLYALGLLWLRRRCSGIVAGAPGDAEAVVKHIVQP